MSLVFSAKQCW